MVSSWRPRQPCRRAATVLLASGWTPSGGPQGMPR